MANDALHKSIQNIINDDKPTVRKSIVIGVGGSGMKGVLSAKKWIEKNIPAEAHRYMRWVGIDTTDIETSIEGKGGRYRFPADQFFQEERRMLYLSSPTPAELSMEFLRDKHANDPCFDWLPNPDAYDISTRAGQGANQTRPLGRLAFFYNEDNIRKALIKERDRLDNLTDDPKYFQLMDVKEGGDKKDEVISFQIKRGVNRYNFRDKIPADHFVTIIEPDALAKSVLCPHINGKVEMKSFPCDEQGHYFEVSGGNFDGKEFKFRVAHTRRKGQISIFLTASIVGGTGNGMILDLAAMVRDIFKDHWPKPRIYGILVLPSAFKRVVSNRNARANAYAALKEIDYFMSGSTFRAQYPSGRKVEVADRLFDDGMLYMLDVENMAGNSLQGRDQVQDLTGQFISTFVSSIVGGAIEERMVNDSTRASIFLPKDDKAQRKACYNSFGISRVIYPVPDLKEIGYRIMAVKMIDAFFRPVKGRLMSETLGDINRGLVRALRLDCRMIFERTYPDYKADIAVEMTSYRKKLASASESGDKRAVTMIIENVIRDYGKGELEKLKSGMMARMEKRYRLELEKIKGILVAETGKYITDPERGFLFAAMAADLLLEKLDRYQKRYYRERVALARYSSDDMEKILERAEKSASPDIKAAEAVVEMAAFNFGQLVYESMLTAAEAFTRELRAVLFNIKNTEISVLSEKVSALRNELMKEIEGLRFKLLEEKNPLFFYLISGKEINAFIEKYFYSRLSVEDLCREVDFIKFDREDDADQFIQTYLISTEGLAIIEMDAAEVKDLISTRFGDLKGKNIDEVKEVLYADPDKENGLTLSETTILKIEIDNIKKKLFQLIHSRFEGFSFESISIKQILDERKVPLNRLLEKLDGFSRPYIYLDNSGLSSVEYFRTVTNFPLNTYEDGDEPDKGTPNDLPPRLNHYKKRENADPDISVETFEVPNLCKPYEMISIGVLLGFPIFKINSLEESAVDYHSLISERSHPLHLFNHPSFDAKYFPDPFRKTNYLNPAKLWSGLVLLKILEEKEGVYSYEERLAVQLKELEARENYKRVILELEKKIIQQGGFEKIQAELLGEVVSGLGILAKNPADGKLQFRREYSLVLMDIMDGDGTGERASGQGMSKDEYIEKNLQNPKFAHAGELAVFLEGDHKIRDFLVSSIKSVMERSRGNVTAGADISLPAWKIEQTELPKFKDKFEFYDYFEKRGSLEWQNILMETLSGKLDDYVSSSKFRMESDPTLIDKSKVTEFLKSLDQKMPDVVLRDVSVKNRIVK
jgi:hypothetical protein